MSRLIDEFMPEWDYRERHGITVAASQERTFAAIEGIDLSGSRIVRALFRIRGLPTDALSWQGLIAMGFTPLASEPSSEVVVGLTGRFWKPGGDLVDLDADDFTAFTDPTYVKTAVNFAVEERSDGSTLTTETRILCTSADAKRRFRWYWSVVRPFSGLIRRVMLRTIKQQAEAR